MYSNKCLDLFKKKLLAILNFWAISIYVPLWALYLFLATTAHKITRFQSIFLQNSLRYLLGFKKQKILKDGKARGFKNWAKRAKEQEEIASKVWTLRVIEIRKLDVWEKSALQVFRRRNIDDKWKRKTNLELKQLQDEAKLTGIIKQEE